MATKRTSKTTAAKKAAPVAAPAATTAAKTTAKTTTKTTAKTTAAAAKTKTFKKHPLALIILDGFGYRKETEGNAIAMAKKPVLDEVFSAHPHTLIGASGMDVGLPDGQMGNSEVGHTNIGAGRIVYQELTRITKAIQDGAFFENEAFLHAVEDFGGRCQIIEGSHYIVELTDTTDSINYFIEELREYHITEISRTGGVALQLSKETVY